MRNFLFYRGTGFFKNQHYLEIYSVIQNFTQMKNKFLVLCAFILACSFTMLKTRPTIYIIGDSTVRNGSGAGSDGLWGWGSFMNQQFDTVKVKVENHAIGGRSSRTFLTEGRWDKIMAKLKKGDYVIMQFGHNDGGAINDTSRARGSIKGIGNESEEIDNLLTKKHEIVHSYGWYMRKYVQETQEKGATPIVCSLVPRNVWKNGKVERAGQSYGLWAKQIAEENKAYFIDLNEVVAAKYEELGKEQVDKFFPKDHTHPNYEGSKLTAQIVSEQIQQLKKCKLKKLLK